MHKAFVEGERVRLGREHVTIRTQYELQAASGAGRLFTPELICRIEGTYGRQLCPEEGAPSLSRAELRRSLGSSLLDDPHCSIGSRPHLSDLHPGVETPRPIRGRRGLIDPIL